MRMLCAQFNKVLSDMEFLSKLDLSHCFLRGRLRSLLDGCTQPIAFLCLQVGVEFAKLFELEYIYEKANKSKRERLKIMDVVECGKI